MCKTIENSHWESVINHFSRHGHEEESFSGTNVILCCEGGRKLRFHEIFVRRFTKIFDVMKHLSREDVESLKDPFGNLVFIFQGISFPALNALSELIYSGNSVITEDIKSELLSLLKKDVSLACWPKPLDETADNVIDAEAGIYDEHELSKQSTIDDQDPEDSFEKEDLDCS